jgi:hypothetical protein
MNFLAHGLLHLDAPWTLTGTALPDWLRLLHRKARVNLAEVRKVAATDGGRRGRLAQGLLAHHEDDRRFHQSQAFEEATRSLTDQIRAHNTQKLRIRPSFVSHILLEMLLDAALMAADETRVDRYYESLAQVEPADVWDQTKSWVPVAADDLPLVMTRFVQIGFLREYQHDERVLFRLGQVMSRVRLESPTPVLGPLMPQLRREVAQRADALLLGAKTEP